MTKRSNRLIWLISAVWMDGGDCGGKSEIGSLRKSDLPAFYR